MSLNAVTFFAGTETQINGSHTASQVFLDPDVADLHRGVWDLAEENRETATGNDLIPVLESWVFLEHQCQQNTPCKGGTLKPFFSSEKKTGYKKSIRDLCSSQGNQQEFLHCCCWELHPHGRFLGYFSIFCLKAMRVGHLQ